MGDWVGKRGSILSGDLVKGCLSCRVQIPTRTTYADLRRMNRRLYQVPG